MLMNDYIIMPDSNVEEIEQEDPVLEYENKNYSVPVRDTGINYCVIKYSPVLKEEDDNDDEEEEVNTFTI